MCVKLARAKLRVNPGNFTFDRMKKNYPTHSLPALQAVYQYNQLNIPVSTKQVPHAERIAGSRM